MYCVKCGVELADSERKCPLCQTPVYYPDLPELRERPYPDFVKANNEISPRGLYFIVSIIFAIALAITTICDISLNGGFTWSIYVSGGLIFSYTVFVLPGWFKRRSPAIFIPVDFAAAALFVLVICLYLGADWYLSFALPIIGALALIVSAVCILCYYLRAGYLYIFGGMLILLGFYSVFIEILIHANGFVEHKALLWSLYPLAAFFMLGMMLIIIAIVPPFRESLKKIFTI